MAKWFGKIGFATLSETVPGVWEETIQEREYFGDLIRYTRRFENGTGLNSDINISNDISILADPFANENIDKMRYAEFNGTRWIISTVSVEFPRLKLTLGGVYNGPEA